MDEFGTIDQVEAALHILAVGLSVPNLPNIPSSKLKMVEREDENSQLKNIGPAIANQVVGVCYVMLCYVTLQ